MSSWTRPSAAGDAGARERPADLAPGLERRELVRAGRDDEPAERRPARLAVPAEQALLAVRVDDQRIAVLDLADARRPRLAQVIEPPFRSHDVVFASDGAHVWVTSGASNALAIYRLAGGAPRVLAAPAPPQHVAFVGRLAFVASGRDGTVQRRRLDGRVVRVTRVPHGSYNVTCANAETPFARTAIVTPSLNEGTVAVLTPGGDVRFVRRVTRSAHDACVALAG